MAETIGDSALATYNKHRLEVGDEFTVVGIEDEFPYLAQEMAREFGARSLYLARADANESGTFKVRGALVALAHLAASTPSDRSPDAIWAYSAGNFASGLAVAGRVLGVPRHIAVPKSAPFEKREGLYRFDDDRASLYVHPIEGTLEDARDWVESDSSRVTVSPFDDPYVIAGQGTHVDDLLERLPDVNRIVVPVGGGGLVAGIRQRLDELEKDDVIVHGIEAEGSDSMSRSITAGERTDATGPNRHYGGSAVRLVGKHTLEICKRASDQKTLEVLSVADVEVDKLMADYVLSNYHREYAALNIPEYEPTALVAVAGLRKVATLYPKDVIAVIGTGHNAPLPQYI
ncbi:MAG TPA: pyridoxal-phosphate dependent enzyme [Candidatus Saccharimonadales bacterium]|nr:pyridoxal-phosphate dependent enzyme [Candidatus Saccharimonadales bacterium]